MAGTALGRARTGTRVRIRVRTMVYSSTYSSSGVRVRVLEYPAVLEYAHVRVRTRIVLTSPYKSSRALYVLEYVLEYSASKFTHNTTTSVQLDSSTTEGRPPIIQVRGLGHQNCRAQPQNDLPCAHTGTRVCVRTQVRPRVRTSTRVLSRTCVHVLEVLSR